MSQYETMLLAGGILLGLASVFSIKQIQQMYFTLKIKSQYKKELKKREDRVKEYKESGKLHKWVTLPVRAPDGSLQETQVCEETGYCPLIDGFCEVHKIKQLLSDRELEKEYLAFKKEEIVRIKDYYGIEECDINSLVDDVLSIKKNFHIKKTEKSIAEMKKMFPNAVVIGDVKDLPDAIKKVKERQQ